MSNSTQLKCFLMLETNRKMTTRIPMETRNEMTSLSFGGCCSSKSNSNKIIKISLLSLFSVHLFDKQTVFPLLLLDGISKLILDYGTPLNTTGS